VPVDASLPGTSRSWRQTAARRTPARPSAIARPSSAAGSGHTPRLPAASLSRPVTVRRPVPGDDERVVAVPGATRPDQPRCHGQLGSQRRSSLASTSHLPQALQRIRISAALTGSRSSQRARSCAAGRMPRWPHPRHRAILSQPGAASRRLCNRRSRAPPGPLTDGTVLPPAGGRGRHPSPGQRVGPGKGRLRGGAGGQASAEPARDRFYIVLEADGPPSVCQPARCRSSTASRRRGRTRVAPPRPRRSGPGPPYNP